jgi:Fic family protein
MIPKYTKEELYKFLEESNAIESVYDSDSFIQALKAWGYLIQQKVLTLPVILETHRILMQNQPLEEHEKGEFRKCAVWIGEREGIKWRLVPSEILMWCFETMRASPKVDAIALHVRYEKIHPFVDGNGRTGRLFMNWTRVVRNDEPLIIFTEKDKQNYYKLFQ